MSLQKISDVKHPKVGRFYLVPTIESNFAAHVAEDYRVPVIGPWHEDAEIIEFPDYHFHIDVRFTKKLPDCIILSEEKNPIYAPQRALARVDTGSLRPKEPLVEWRALKMMRQMPEFIARQLNNWERLEEKFKDVGMKCMTCPHRGMPLTGLPIKNGVVVCNGHGLAWNVETGKMVPR